MGTDGLILDVGAVTAWGRKGGLNGEIGQEQHWDGID